MTTSTGKIWSDGLDLSRSGVATVAIVDPAAGESYADEVAEFRALVADHDRVSEALAATGAGALLVV